MSSIKPLHAPSDFVVRTARQDDAAALHELTVESAGAMERFDGTFDAAAAAIKIHTESLSGERPPEQRSYVLLVEASTSGQVIGCISITCRIGLDQAFYDYRLGKIVHSSQPLKSYRCLDVLYLCNDLTGSSEIHSLYVRPAFRKQGVAWQLFKAVQFFIATRVHEFAPRVIAELRGVVDGNGTPPFWEAVGRHFFRVDQSTAERMVAKGRKAFIAELMPKHPVYLTLLSDAAQQAVGGVHEDLLRLMPLLDADGFHFESHVDIFDGGRVIEARTHELDSVVNGVTLSAKAGMPTDAKLWWVASGSAANFRMTSVLGRQDGENFLTENPNLQRLGIAEMTPISALIA